ncbi:hypothetical protein CRG98_042547 [Punica granatum]|uniref:Salicylate carboxymethyltransferase-like n=1 Tax=Punica granatum TaxID=22663 RepID=A0A2I0HZE7_PUNGR|nr:hypothetical protein CRG98_042547 [Punica granatum]
MASTSPSSVFQAYIKQFQKDFTNLLSSRAEEIVPGGEMVLILIGRSIPDPTSKDCCLLFWWLSRSLVEMADQGLVEAADIDSFNLPFYTPYKHERTQRSTTHSSTCGPLHGLIDPQSSVLLVVRLIEPAPSLHLRCMEAQNGP